jgi:hypothetical protein
MAKTDTANLLRQAVGDKIVEKGFGAGTGQSALRERGHIEQPDIRRRVGDFLANRLEPTRTPE